MMTREELIADLRYALGLEIVDGPAPVAMIDQVNLEKADHERAALLLTMVAESERGAPVGPPPWSELPPC